MKETMSDKLYIATPTTRLFDGKYVTSLLHMEKPMQVQWEVVEGQAIDVGRNTLVDHFLLSPEKPDYLLMCDSDASWHPKAVMRLWERDVDVVSGMVFRRGLPPVPTIGPLAGIDMNGNYLYNFGATMEKILAIAERDGIREDTANELVLSKHPEDLWEVDGAGAHFMLIKRHVLEKMKPPWYQHVGPGAGEDFYFCRRLREMGIKIHVDLSVYTGHVIGPGIEIGIREFLAFYKYSDLIKKDNELWKVGLK